MCCCCDGSCGEGELRRIFAGESKEPAAGACDAAVGLCAPSGAVMVVVEARAEAALTGLAVGVASSRFCDAALWRTGEQGASPAAAVVVSE